MLKSMFPPQLLMIEPIWDCNNPSITSIEHHTIPWNPTTILQIKPEIRLVKHAVEGWSTCDQDGWLFNDRENATFIITSSNKRDSEFEIGPVLGVSRIACSGRNGYMMSSRVTSWISRRLNGTHRGDGQRGWIAHFIWRNSLTKETEETSRRKLD